MAHRAALVSGTRIHGLPAADAVLHLTPAVLRGRERWKGTLFRSASSHFQPFVLAAGARKWKQWQSE